MKCTRKGKWNRKRERRSYSYVYKRILLDKNEGEERRQKKKRKLKGFNKKVLFHRTRKSIFSNLKKKVDNGLMMSDNDNKMVFQILEERDRKREEGRGGA